MCKNIFRPSFIFLLLISVAAIQIFSQSRACRKVGKAALHPLPKFDYQCPELDESDDAILTRPARLKVLSAFVKSLETFTFADWWKAPVKGLNACYSRKTPVEGYEIPLYEFFGTGNLRVLKVADPCYQIHYGGANIYLLNRKNGKVYVSRLWDGFYNRNPDIGVRFALQGREPIIEIGTATTGLNLPFLTSYFFAVNPKTNHAAPKNLFLDADQKPTNSIFSWMDMTDDPAKDKPLHLIQKGRLARSFYVLDNESGDENLTKRTLRWNGKFYQ